MAKHYIKAGKPRASKPKAEIKAAPTWFEKTHPVGSAERFLDDAAREALAMAAAGGLPTPKSVAADAIKATVRDALRKYPDPLLDEAAKLPRDELVRRAADAAAYQKAMEARNRAADLAAAAMSPFGNMAMTTAAADAAEDLGVQQDAGGGYTGGRNTVSRVEARNTTKRERERVATIEAALREERRPKLEARSEEPSRPPNVLRAPRSPFPQTLATSLGAEVDPMETAKAGYRAVARGEAKDPILSPGEARIVSAGLAGFQGLETAAGLTGVGNPNRITPPEIRAPGHSLGARGAEAGYLAEKLGVPVTEVLKAKATEGKDLMRASTRRAAQAKAQQADAKMRNRIAWLERRAGMEDSAQGVFEPPLMLDQAKRGSTVVRPSKAKAPADIWVSTAQHILDQLASGQSMSEIGKTIPKEITDKLAKVNGRLDASSLKAANDFFTAMWGLPETAAGLDPLMNQRGPESAVYSVLNRVLGSRGVDLEPGVYDFLANAPGLHKLKARILSRPDIPKGAYDAFLMSDKPSDLALTTIAQKPDLSDSQVELLLRQGSPFVRAVVASRNDLSETGVRWLWQNDPSSLVRRSIASRKGLPDDIVRDALADKDVVKDPFVQLRLVSDKRVPSDLAFGILTGRVPHDTTSPVSKLVIAQAVNRPDLDMPGVLRQLYSDAVAARSAEQAQHIPENPASDIIAPQDGKVSDGVLAVAKHLKTLAPYLARQVDLALTDNLPAGLKRDSQARARRAGLLTPISLGTEDKPVETFRLFHRAAEALDAARVKHNPAYDFPGWVPSDGEAVIPDVKVSGNVKHTFESYLDYFSGKRVVAAERKAQAKQYDGTPLGKAYQKELRKARKAGLDHVPMVLQRGVPLSRGEKDIMVRGLESPSMYAIDAFRLPSVSKGFRTDPEDYNMPYLVYQMKPDQFAVGRKNLTYAIGADGGTGESADLSTLRNQAGRYMREFGTMPSMDTLRHMVTGRQKRQRFAQILEQDDSPAGVRLREALQKELLSEGSIRGSSQSRAVRRAYEDYIADSWYDKTGLFSDAFDQEQRLVNFDRAKRAGQGHRHLAPEFFTRSAKGDHPVLPLEGQKFMHQAMYDHPGTYAEIKSLKAFPVARLSDAIGNVLFVWDDASKNTPVDHPRIIKLQEQLDSLGITYENVQGDEGRVKAQQTSPFQMDVKGGDTRQDAKGGDAFDPAKDRLAVPEGREKEYEEYMDSLANLDTSTHKNYLVPKDWRTNTEYNKDYDYVAAFLADKAQPVQADDGYWHMSDVGKMPNHPTFSVESYYARDPKWAPYAGRWEGERYIPPEVRQDAKGGDSVPGPVSGNPEPVSKSPGNVSGGPRIVINPQIFDDKRDALCVAFNEAFRLVMEENAFEPVSEPTEKQRKFFADTAYAGDELQLRRTILARIATLDTSVSDPTDEQLEETAEMLEMVMEVGAPQNEWEQQAVQRLHDVVARAREAHAPEEEEPLPPQDEASTRADVGGGVAKEDWTDGDVRYIEQNGGYYKQTYRKGATEATSGWMGQVIQKDEWDAAQKSMQGGASANETAEAWDKGAEQRAAAREAEVKTRAAALEETNRINMLVAKGTLGYKTGRALLASAADAVSGSDAEAIANLGSKLDTVEQKAEALARIKSAGIDMSLAPAGLEAEDYKDMARGAVNAIVNAPIYVAEGIAQTGAAAIGAVTGVAKGVASGTGLVSGVWHGIGDAMGAVHAAGDSLRGAVNLDYKGARREMGDLPVAKGLPSLNQIESGVLTTIGGLATPGMLMKGMRGTSVAPRAAQAVKPAAQTAKSSLSKLQAIQPIPVKQAAERAAQAVKPAAQTAKSSLSKFQALQPIPVKQTIRSAGTGAQPIKTASTVKPVQSVLAPGKAGLQSFVPKAVFGEARPGEIVFGKKPWGTIQQLAKERGITLPSTFKPSIGGTTLQERVASVWADPARFNSANPAYVRSFGYISAPNRVIVKPGFQFRGTSRSAAGQFVGMSSRNGVGVHYTPEEFAGGRALELARGADHFGMFGQNGEFFPIW